MKLRSVLLFALVVLVATACTTPPPKSGTSKGTRANAPMDGEAIARFDVEVVVDSSGVAISTDSKCKDANGVVTPDCAEVMQSKYAQFVFSLFDEDQDDGTSWQFAGIVICRAGQKSLAGCRLTPLQRLEFVIAAVDRTELRLPSRTGRVNLAAIEENLQTFELWDMNNLQREFEYGIMVCPVGTATPGKPNSDGSWTPCRVADPKIKNLGRRLN